MRLADPVARGIEDDRGQVADIEVEGQHRALTQLVERWHWPSRGLPRCVQIPAAALGLITDVVAHCAGLCLGRHIVTPISKADILDAVPAMGPVSQAGERRGQLDLQPALLGMPADRLVAPVLVRLTVSGDEPPGRLPATTPLPAVDACGIKVVAGLGTAAS